MTNGVLCIYYWEKDNSNLKYDEVRAFPEDGLARVKLDNKWGFINKTGEEVIPLQYDDADYFKDGVAKVKLGDEEFLLTKKEREYE